MSPTEATLMGMLKQPNRRFAWGRYDCFLWAADAVQALTGADPAADLRGTYSTPWGAIKALRRLGGLQALAASRFGPPVDPATALPGAVVMLNTTVCQGPTRQQGALGVLVLGGPARRAGVVVAQGEQGFVLVSQSAAVAAWQGGSACPT